jgi:hypothetical protein
MKNETIRNLQREIEEKYSMRTLHILNGLCMLDSFQKGHLMSEKNVYIPFNEAMCCQMNFITILSYLDQNHSDGDVLFCMVQEQTDKMLSDAVKIDIDGYNNIYKTILCDRKKCDAKLLPVTYQAMNLYLSYGEENSDIIRHIKKNLNKENIVEELLTLFPQYGLGDLQYKWMLEEIKK